MNRTNDTEPDDDSMRAVSHTNPYTGETAGRLFSRGPTVVADGGRRNGADDENPAATDPQSDDDTMKRVDHTPPEGADDANDVFERGNEHGRDDERVTDV